MAKVFYIPYATYEIKSNSSKEELVHLIRSEISNHNLIDELTKRNKGKFKGAINMSTGDFRVRRELNNNNHFNPLLLGQIIETQNGSIIKIRLKMRTFILIFLVIFCALWLSIRLWTVDQFEDHIITIGGLGFIYFLTFFGFNMGAGAALDSMHEMV